MADLIFSPVQILVLKVPVMVHDTVMGKSSPEDRRMGQTGYLTLLMVLSLVLWIQIELYI